MSSNLLKIFRTKEVQWGIIIVSLFVFLLTLKGCFIDSSRKSILTQIAETKKQFAASTSVVVPPGAVPPPGTAQPLRSMAETLAQEAGKCVDGRGDVVAIRAKIEDLINQDQVTFLSSTFEKSLGDHSPRVKIIAWEDYYTGPRSLAAGMDLEFYEKVVQKYPNVSAIISFVGPPNYLAKDVSVDAKQFPPLISMVDNYHDLPDLIREGIVHVAIVPYSSLDNHALRLTKGDAFKSSSIPEFSIVTESNLVSFVKQVEQEFNDNANPENQRQDINQSDAPENSTPPAPSS